VKTIFIGAGQGGREVLELVQQGRLGFLGIEVLGVVDADAEAPGLRFAREQGWATFGRLEEGLAVPGLELVIELTGRDDLLARVNHLVPQGVRVMDHVMARVFWDLEKVSHNLRDQLDETRRLQARVARDRAELQEILDTIPDMLVVLDRSGRVERVNRRFQEVTGKTRDEVRGQVWADLFAAARSDVPSAAFISPFPTVMQTGNPVTVVYSDEAAEAGQERHFQVAANPIFDERDQIIHVVQTSREITEQVRLKRETEESARRFQQIINAVHGMVTIKDLTGRYLVINPWTEKIVGIPIARMIGKTAADLFPRETADLIQSLDEKTLAKGARHVSEEVVTVGGKERTLISERFPLTDYKGELVGICCVSQDQTRRRQLQRELIQTERLAAIGKLAAGVAHEINNPLSGILTFAQDLLLECSPADPAREDYELIVNETLRCRRIVRDLLEYSRQKSPRRRRMGIGELVSRVLPLVERQASFHNIQFEVIIEEGLPEVEADPQQMQQVLLNLVINARDAMRASGTIRISGTVAEAGRSVALSVADSGCGIPAKQVERIFEPFYSTKGEQGHGLGLMAVRNVVDRHGGRIEVASEAGRGSTFRVLLPAAWD
jgi:PAS domain S-box-containing protein